MKRTFADRPNWTRVLEKRFKLTYLEEKNFKGYVSIIHIHRVKQPLVIEVSGKDLQLADNGFIWIQHFPENSNYALTTMINEKQEVVQWYFDICGGNKINSSGMPYYDDLYLDVVLVPTGEILLLDEDELEQALKDKDITKEQYELAHLEAKKLIQDIQKNKEILPLDTKYYLERMLALD